MAATHAGAGATQGVNVFEDGGISDQIIASLFEDVEFLGITSGNPVFWFAEE